MPSPGSVLLPITKGSGGGGGGGGGGAVVDDDEPLPPLRQRAPLEFACAMFLVVTLATGMMVKAWTLSARYDPGLHSDARPLPGLQPGWFMGRHNDLSDHQWRVFRDNLPKLALLAVLTVPMVTAVRRFAPKRASAPFHAVYGVAYVVYLHGARTAWIAALVLTHFAVCRAFAGTPRIGPLAVWASGCGLLVVVQFYADTWKFAHLGIGLDSLDEWYQGAMPRWWVHYNLVTLRILGYGMDLHWRRAKEDGGGGNGGGGGGNGNSALMMTSVVSTAATTSTVSSSTAAPAAPTPTSAGAGAGTVAGGGGGYFHLVEHPSPDVSYSLVEYAAFVSYPPLYIAGPTSSFNAFASQLHVPQQSHTHAMIARYAVVKFVVIVLAAEVFTHTVYANALAVSREWKPSAGDFGPDDVGVTSLMTLNFMWFKFAVIWRFFRLWALTSGVEVPENMLRCVNNNSTILGFWRGWHASYNRWLVRYLYVPLGGNRYKLLNVWVVFIFVGAWHDRLRWRLLHWACIFAAFLAPELGVQAIGRRLFPTFEARDTLMYRLCRCFAGALNIHVLIAGNMVGYVVGLDDMWDALGTYASGRGGWFVATSMVFIMSAAHLGFEQRDGEDRARRRAKAC